ncbi:Metal Ion (Mn2 -iron) Transporter (Nramp) Family [Phytophthora cinnamomi]|uniref:Metal Ion (Mn2 -iron) Transporter (Nramp) Family n=1 Tax=Phytophthora cinnamomi TaxID=4785 RepID=UPI00355952E3|nr:Metal Ion (Mn2 -iron) Transporter (Nramp) Family [Phytophthora cinnamomi]
MTASIVPPSPPPSERDLLIPVDSEAFQTYSDFNKTSVHEVDTPDEEPTTHGFSWRTLWAYAGPGWLMSIAYVDPGNLESDLQAGAYGGYQLIWVLLAATAMGYFLQVLAARLGVVTGKNLAEVCSDVYPRWASLTLWIMTEIAIVGSDIQEVLGSSIAFQVLFGFPLWIGCLITGFDTFTFLLLHRYGIRKLEAFFVSLIVIMLVCFCANLVRGGASSSDVARGFVPRVESYAVTQAVGIVGAVIMPHNIFLHSALVQSRQVNRQNVRKVREANKYFAIESAIALFVSFLINLAVLAVFAKGFFSSDCSATFEADRLNTACVPGAAADGDTFGVCQLANGGEGMCQAIGLSQAGVALSGMLGQYADVIWAIGLLAAGQSSTMTGTYAGQFVMEGFLNLRISPWKRVALTRCVSLVPAMTVAILSQRNPGDSDTMDEMLNVLQSIQLPFALLPVLIFTSSPATMGDFVNSKATVVSGWLLGGLVCIINLYLVFTNLERLSLGSVGLSTLLGVCCLYFGFLAFLMRMGTSGPSRQQPRKLTSLQHVPQGV